ncbi:MAG TPA: metallophosphoesterase [Candidatus Binatia bacterium]|nr:metallophosphoesterase [Candidatus Binatia bacterium]
MLTTVAMGVALIAILTIGVGRSMFRRPTRYVSTATRCVTVGQVLLNATLLSTGVWLMWSGIRLALFVVALVPLAFVPFSYARVRLHRLIEGHFNRFAMWTVVAIGLGCDAIMAAQMVTARQMRPPAVVSGFGITWVGAVWFSAHALLLLGYGLLAVARGSRRTLWKLVPSRPAVARPDERSLARRELLQRVGLVGAALPFGVSLSSARLSYDFRVEQREIVLPLWPAALDGLRIVHLSDIHVGGSMDRRRVLRVAALANQCRPDLVLHTGDFLTHRAGDFDAPLYEAVARIQAPHGQFACLGNHDFDDPQRLERRLRESGVIVLRNRMVAIVVRGEALEIAGLDFQHDRLQRAAVQQRIIESWGPRGRAPRILLDHDPTMFAALPDGCADLVLSGHTHGGHIGVQLDSSHAITLVGLAGFPDQGLFSRGDLRMYVTRCVGFYGYPMRIGIPPEIALLILRSPRPI